MAKTVHVIGIEASELPLINTVLTLLRHSDPRVPDMCRQAILYIRDYYAEPDGRNEDQQIAGDPLR